MIGEKDLPEGIVSVDDIEPWLSKFEYDIPRMVRSILKRIDSIDKSIEEINKKLGIGF